jgi:hypothetical protein
MDQHPEHCHRQPDVRSSTHCRRTVLGASSRGKPAIDVEHIMGDAIPGEVTRHPGPPFRAWSGSIATTRSAKCRNISVFCSCVRPDIKDAAPALGDDRCVELSLRKLLIAIAVQEFLGPTQFPGSSSPLKCVQHKRALLPNQRRRLADQPLQGRWRADCRCVVCF